MGYGFWIMVYDLWFMVYGLGVMYDTRGWSSKRAALLCSVCAVFVLCCMMCDVRHVSCELHVARRSAGRLAA